MAPDDHTTLSDVLRQVRQTIGTHDMLARGTQLVVGVSGGPDSLCLLHVLVRLRHPLGLGLHVGHLNHGARGAAADADAGFVEMVAADWNLPATVEKLDVVAFGRAHKLTFEEAARRVRYAFLSRIAERIGAGSIAVGHNADDQAETVLMHLLRGSGSAGLRGMLHVTPITDCRLLDPFFQGHVTDLAIIRPILDVPRDDIEHYCEEAGLVPRFDRSNLDTTHFRNRLRHELLPVLSTYNPKIRDRLRHTASVITAEHRLLTQVRDRAWARTVRAEPDGWVVFDRSAWRALSVALQRATLRHATYRLRQGLRDVGFVHIENARRVGLRSETGSQATLPQDLCLTVGYDYVALGPAGDAGQPPDQPLLGNARLLPVQLPGAVRLPETEWALRIEVPVELDAARIVANRDSWTAYVDADALTDPLALRSRRPGDRFRPHGLGGHTVKLSKLMINLKIPRAWRDQIPVLVSGEDIVWLCGYRIGEDIAIGPATQRVARLRFRRVDMN